MRRYPDRGLHGKTVEDLGRRIVSGEIAVSESIDIDELVERHDASRGVVREALRVLGAKGLVDARPRRGTFVTTRASWSLLDPDVLRWQFEMMPNIELLEKLAEIRVMIEPGAAALAAQRRTAEDMKLIDESLEAIRRGDESAAALDAAVDGDIQFHTSIVRATHNELVQQLVGVIEIGLRVRDEFVSRTHNGFGESWTGHAAVADAIRNGDPDGASATMLELVQGAARDARTAAAAHKA